MALTALTMLVSGCGTTISDACPVEVKYSAAFQDKLAGELSALAPGAALGVAMADYGRLRDQVRACRGGKR